MVLFFGYNVHGKLKSSFYFMDYNYVNFCKIYLVRNFSSTTTGQFVKKAPPLQNKCASDLEISFFFLKKGKGQQPVQCNHMALRIGLH